MLAARHRLRRRREFAATIRAGRRERGGVVVVHIRRQDGAAAQACGAARVGFVVGRTVGGAVVRNRVRRRLRHLVRDRLDALPPGVRLVVRALPGAATRSYPQLGADLDAALAAVLPARRPAGPARRRGPTDVTGRGKGLRDGRPARPRGSVAPGTGESKDRTP